MPTRNKDDGEVYNFTAPSTKKTKMKRQNKSTTPPSFHTNRLWTHGQYMFTLYAFVYTGRAYVCLSDKRLLYRG